MNKTKYDEVVSAADKDWKSKIRAFIEHKKTFAVIDITNRVDYRHCIALADEFDYRNPYEDESAVKAFPDAIPHTLGFVHKSTLKVKRVSN